MSSLVSAFLIVWWITFVAVQGVLLVRRWVNVEVLEQHNEVAGFIYAVIGVLYAVCLGFTDYRLGAVRPSSSCSRKGGQSSG